MSGHKRLLEATNHGHYFADCGCGASLGVYPSRSSAAAAHTAHLMVVRVCSHPRTETIRTLKAGAHVVRCLECDERLA